MNNPQDIIGKREIKFRAWNKRTEKMYKDVQSLYDDDPRGMFSSSGNGTPYYCFGHSCECEDTFLMQYTGLKDKNGKEIYEGDIIGYGESDMYIVFFEDASFYFSPIDDMSYIESEFEGTEVRGNIFENPELL